MKLRLLATPLLATGLLLSTLGCSKKEDAKPTANTGSYKLDNTLYTCQAKASVTSYTSGNFSYDRLIIDLVTTPTPATGAETLHLSFIKDNNPLNNSYALFDVVLTTKGTPTPYFFSVDHTSVTPTSSGGFSGTFSANISSLYGTPPPYTGITDGTFTDVHP